MIEYDLSRTTTTTEKNRHRLLVVPVIMSKERSSTWYLDAVRNADLPDLAEAIKQMTPEQRAELFRDVGLLTWEQLLGQGPLPTREHLEQLQQQRDELQARVKELEAGIEVVSNDKHHVQLEASSLRTLVQATELLVAKREKERDELRKELAEAKEQRDDLEKRLNARTDPAPAWLAKWPEWALKELAEMAERRCLREWLKGGGASVNEAFEATKEALFACDAARPRNLRVYAAETAIMHLLRALAQAGEG